MDAEKAQLGGRRPTMKLLKTSTICSGSRLQDLGSDPAQLCGTYSFNIFGTYKDCIYTDRTQVGTVEHVVSEADGGKFRQLVP